jgi:hypothetical protein
MAVLALAVAALAGLLARPLPAAASGRSNPSYEGVFASTDPDRYRPTPDQWTAGDTVAYHFTVTNSSMLPMSVTFTVYAQRITSIDGSDVSSGQPGVSEATVLDGNLGGDQPVQIAVVNDPILPLSSVDYTETVPTEACGYLLIWAGQSTDRSDPSTVLNEGATRTTGCATATPTHTPRPPTPRPAPRHHLTVATPSPKPSASPSPTPSPAPKKAHRKAGTLPITAGSLPSGPGDGAGPPPVLGAYQRTRTPEGVDRRGLLLSLVVLAAAAAIGALLALRRGWLPRPDRLRRASRPEG